MLEGLLLPHITEQGDFLDLVRNRASLLETGTFEGCSQLLVQLEGS